MNTHTANSFVTDEMVMGMDDMADLPRARASDPLSSHLAAAGSVRFADSHAARILHVLKNGFSDGMCAEEIGECCGLTVVQVDRRTVELQRKGLIRVVQRDGADLLANGMRVWEAT
ncbi:hypothetical protein ABIC89_001037 [Variovorax boronicumulans]|uniref:hypothetical protein n=1 Tax=Variovorax boronicumulans TaxID=436515 RepID=UPI003396D1EB